MRARLGRLAWACAIGGGAVATIYVVAALVPDAGDSDEFGRVRVTRIGVGEPLELEDGSRISSHTVGSTRRTSVWRAEVPADGRYGVVTSAGPGVPHANRAVTFGPDAELGKARAVAVVVGLLLGGLVWVLGRRHRTPPATLSARA